MTIAALLLAVGAGVAPPACGSTCRATDPPRLVPAAGPSGNATGLALHRRWSARVGQGARPGDDGAFRALAALGYRDIVSVESAPPDEAGAAVHGLRYVHVPLRHDAISEPEARAIVRAVQDARGPVYVHGRHGRHRGPAAAMLARIAVDGISNVQAVGDLKLSGCSESYRGLYRAVAEFRVPTDLRGVPQELAHAEVDVDYR